MRVSFEFFPPRTAQGRANLARTAGRLRRAGPEFFSVTYGARRFDAGPYIRSRPDPLQ